MVNITTLDGRRLDLTTNETIEINMGGLSLLSLADRATTYTNSFKIPRTARNEAIFDFASQPTRNNRPSIDVVITKGLFQSQATLNVKDFDGDYKCDISYDTSVLNKLKAQDLDVFGTFPTTTETAIVPNANADVCVASLWRQSVNVYPLVDYFPIKTNLTQAATPDDRSGTTAARLITILAKTTALTGVQFAGSLLADPYFNRSFIFLQNYGFSLKEVSSVFHIYYEYFNIDQKKVSIAELLKVICQMFFADFKIVGDTVYLNKVNLLGVGILIETLKHKKTFASGYFGENYIKYTAEDKSKEFFGSDTITGEGTGSKELLKIDNYIPLTGVNGYLMGPEKCAGKIAIMIDNDIVESEVSMKSQGGYHTVQGVECYDANAISMAGYYSSVLNPIFANPVMLNADGYIDTLTADSIMASRIITSVKLGGRYWVDEMKYNLITGKSVLKLIKL